MGEIQRKKIRGHLRLSFGGLRRRPDDPGSRDHGHKTRVYLELAAGSRHTGRTGVVDFIKRVRPAFGKLRWPPQATPRSKDPFSTAWAYGRILTRS